jgi:formylmethanofuran dehydrogenase subunit B
MAEAPPCPMCGCDCSIISLDDCCGLGRATAPAVNAPVAMIAGQSVTLDEAVERAAEILSAARYPLVVGLSNSTCETQRAAVALADRLGACLDIAPSPTTPLFADLGTVTCSFGELKNRADLIVFWGGRPHETHPRLATDFALDPLGRFVPNGRRDRTVIVVGDAAVAKAYAAEHHIPSMAGQDFAALWLLRSLVQSRAIDTHLGPVARVPLADWRSLAERLQTCRFGVLFLAPKSSLGPRATEAAHGLATDLNAFTRFYAIPLRPAGNSVGAEQVATWQTGYPAAVGLYGGYPRSFGGEFSAARTLSRGEPDAVLMIGNAADLPPSARDHLRQIPVVALSPEITSLPTPAIVAITAVACANPAGATAFRHDGIALPLRAGNPSSFPDEFQVIQRIAATLRRKIAPR